MTSQGSPRDVDNFQKILNSISIDFFKINNFLQHYIKTHLSINTYQP